ncbi:MAG TPA: HD domain-containing protein [Candidatus Udaeobacter sp.]|jgi:putative hydrolase of HD superfamily|nr:HD domain-containing protein [Candidatus Udaeobacter sp.]
MDSAKLANILVFLREAERLKNVYRTSWTSGGQRESVASHTWRLCLMALIFEQQFEGVDFGRLVKICIVHDLGEAIGGDIPAIDQKLWESKSAQERRDLNTLVTPLPDQLKEEILALWDEYEAAASLEARIAKALDKLETLLQHVQGANPPDAVDYLFNLDYGKKFTDALPLAAEIRSIIDEETLRRAEQR